ncbi:hypothetical protein [Ferrimicrobium acidiphilum]|uniref:Uncharacterized protein n=1 Tax=Ferrimicrobium acidiphilum TaxID=121039 RepID=A0ABV3XZ74_9ACTN
MTYDNGTTLVLSPPEVVTSWPSLVTGKRWIASESRLGEGADTFSLAVYLE